MKWQVMNLQEKGISELQVFNHHYYLLEMAALFSFIFTDIQGRHWGGGSAGTSVLGPDRVGARDDSCPVGLTAGSRLVHVASS